MATRIQPHDTARSIALPARPAAGSGALAGLRTMTGARMAELTLLTISAALLLFSLVFPYWQITLHAPQYPKGLLVQAYAYQLTGDVSEVDGLNHYIGMMKLDDAATIERQIALVAIPIIALLAIASFALRGRWRMLARLPIIIFPVVFVVDLYAWLYYAGHALDPHAALSSSIKPFTPHILGVGRIGQFSTEALFERGFYLAAIAALVVLGLSIWQRGKGDVAR